MFHIGFPNNTVFFFYPQPP